MDPMVLPFVGCCFFIFFLGFIARWWRQPIMVGYMVAGVVVGPGVLGIVSSSDLIYQLGSFGVLLLLFFVGMEFSISDFKANLRNTVLGTLFQIVVSIAYTFALGWWLDWPWRRSLLLGFVISLSSTAVVFRYLQNGGMLNSKVGGRVGNILIAQDFAVIAMLLVLQYISPSSAGHSPVWLQLFGGLLFGGLLLFLFKRQRIQLGLQARIKHDKELQVFLALLICFGFAFMSGVFHLSAALGAFLGGIFISVARETDWIIHSLEPFQILLMAVFFVAIGMMIDIDIIKTYWRTILLLLGIVFILNTSINALMLKLGGLDLKASLYGGALLSQIGEFGFVLATVGVHMETISQTTYQVILCVIALSLFFSPVWFSLTRRSINFPVSGTP